MSSYSESVRKFLEAADMTDENKRALADAIRKLGRPSDIVLTSARTSEQRPPERRLICPRCWGSGDHDHHATALCRRCGGEGFIPAPPRPPDTATATDTRPTEGNA